MPHLEGVNYQELIPVFDENQDGEMELNGASCAGYDPREILDGLHDIGRLSKRLVADFELRLNNAEFLDGTSPRKRSIRRAGVQTSENQIESSGLGTNLGVSVNVFIDPLTSQVNHNFGTVIPEVQQPQAGNDTTATIITGENAANAPGGCEAESENMPTDEPPTTG
ncbi:MAG: hypothetical protein ACKO0V_03320 [bacterium]